MAPTYPRYSRSNLLTRRQELSPKLCKGAIRHIRPGSSGLLQRAEGVWVRLKPPHISNLSTNTGKFPPEETPNAVRSGPSGARHSEQEPPESGGTSRVCCSLF